MGVFTWTRITFRKTFRNVIQNVIGIVIWTHVRLHGLQTPFQSRSGTAHCEWYFAPTTQSARADWPMRLCMASARIFKMHTHESRSETALHLHGLESGFLGGSRSKTPFFRVSKRVPKAWFETAFCLHGLKSGFQIRKRPNQVLKRLSERDSSPCKHTQCLLDGDWQVMSPLESWFGRFFVGVSKHSEEN